MASHIYVDDSLEDDDSLLNTFFSNLEDIVLPNHNTVQPSASSHSSQTTSSTNYPQNALITASPIPLKLRQNNPQDCQNLITASVNRATVEISRTIIRLNATFSQQLQQASISASNGIKSAQTSASSTISLASSSANSVSSSAFSLVTVANLAVTNANLALSSAQATIASVNLDLTSVSSASSSDASRLSSSFALLQASIVSIEASASAAIAAAQSALASATGSAAAQASSILASAAGSVNLPTSQPEQGSPLPVLPAPPIATVLLTPGQAAAIIIVVIVISILLGVATYFLIIKTKKKKGERDSYLDEKLFTSSRQLPSRMSSTFRTGNGMTINYNPPDSPPSSLSPLRRRAKKKGSPQSSIWEAGGPLSSSPVTWPLTLTFSKQVDLASKVPSPGRTSWSLKFDAIDKIKATMTPPTTPPAIVTMKGPLTPNFLYNEKTATPTTASLVPVPTQSPLTGNFLDTVQAWTTTTAPPLSPEPARWPLTVFASGNVGGPEAISHSFMGSTMFLKLDQVKGTHATTPASPPHTGFPFWESIPEKIVVNPFNDPIDDPIEEQTKEQLVDDTFEDPVEESVREEIVASPPFEPLDSTPIKQDNRLITQKAALDETYIKSIDESIPGISEQTMEDLIDENFNKPQEIPIEIPAEQRPDDFDLESLLPPQSTRVLAPETLALFQNEEDLRHSTVPEIDMLLRVVAQQNNVTAPLFWNDFRAPDPEAEKVLSLPSLREPSPVREFEVLTSVSPPKQSADDPTMIENTETTLSPLPRSPAVEDTTFETDPISSVPHSPIVEVQREPSPPSPAPLGQRDISPLRRNPPFQNIDSLLAEPQVMLLAETRINEPEADDRKSRGRSMIRASHLIEARLSEMAFIKEQEKAGKETHSAKLATSNTNQSTHPLPTTIISRENSPLRRNATLRSTSTPRTIPAFKVAPRSSSTNGLSNTLSKFQHLENKNPHDGLMASNEVTQRAIAGIHIPGSLREQAVRNYSTTPPLNSL